MQGKTESTKKSASHIRLSSNTSVFPILADKRRKVVVTHGIAILPGRPLGETQEYLRLVPYSKFKTPGCAEKQKGAILG
jgi:hypothetical protein